MKTRESLVSNSSSSSFILIGIPIDISQLNVDHIIPNGKIELRTIIIGKYLGEGQDVFTLTEEAQLKFIRDYPQLFNRAFVSAKYLYEAEQGMQLKSILSVIGMHNADKLVITGGTADQNSSYTINEMIRNYQSEIEEEIQTIAMKMFMEKYGVKNEG